MGFSEFQRLHKKLSSRLLGLEINFDEDEDEWSDEDDLNQDLVETILERRAQRARVRWQGGIKKVVMLNRFVSAASMSQVSKTKSRLQTFVRKGVYVVTSRALNCPFETVFVRASLGMPKWPQINPLRSLFFDGVPALCLQTLVTHTVDSWVTSVKKPPGFLETLFDNAVFGIKAVLSYPIEVAFTRKIVLGQSYSTSLANLSLASFNGFSSYLVQEGIERAVGAIYTAISGNKDNESLVSWVIYMGVRFFVTIPLIVVRQNIIITSPATPHPAPVGFVQQATAIYQENGLSGLFQGAGTMVGLLCPMFGVFVASQVVVHKILGKTKRELYEEQVEKVREALTFSRKVTVPVENRGHLETIVNIAAKRKHPVVLLVVNGSSESQYSLIAAKKYAENLEGTIIIGDVHRLPFLNKIVNDARIPFFVPIIDRSIELQSVVIYSKDQTDAAFRKLQAI
eukprot:CAMPEP_0203754054 /NCGR_PEP_ID=MMETSP0098-20131031/7717_1 /ASSEMBLY_ACC=CAM_ASM_000208 /TAXON_ID=96639 /ORGANISM=" , Strain NY0313808BC1" /LENGTH=454 /DNA_ID=CAMNT_0050644905 /DNA_START=143 /DNA_END=1504 /DNA_ORIENTATION=-